MDTTVNKFAKLRADLMAVFYHLKVKPCKNPIRSPHISTNSGIFKSPLEDLSKMVFGVNSQFRKSISVRFDPAPGVREVSQRTSKGGDEGPFLEAGPSQATCGAGGAPTVGGRLRKSGRLGGGGCSGGGASGAVFQGENKMTKFAKKPNTGTFHMLISSQESGCKQFC